MGGPDSKSGPALNGAIFFMLGMLGLVFSGIGAVIYQFVRRARNPLPNPVDIANALSSEGEHLIS